MNHVQPNGDLNPCVVCEGEPGFLPRHCPGTTMTAPQKLAVEKGELNFLNGYWIRKPRIPDFIGTMEQVTEFLKRELAKPEGVQA